MTKQELKKISHYINHAREEKDYLFLKETVEIKSENLIFLFYSNDKTKSFEVVRIDKDEDMFKVLNVEEIEALIKIIKEYNV